MASQFLLLILLCKNCNRLEIAASKWSEGKYESMVGKLLTVSIVLHGQPTQSML